MPEEAKETQEQTLDEKMDAVLDEEEKSPPEETSTSKETEGTETEETKPEDTTSQKSDGEETKEDVPKEFHKHPAWQRIIKERDEARAKTGDMDSLKGKVDEFNKVTSSPSYIRESMKSQGFTDEAINAKLKESGHDVVEKPSDTFSLVTSKLNIDPNAMTPEQKGYVEDVAKISRIIAEDIVSRALPKSIQPLSDQVGEITQRNQGEKLFNEIQQIIKEEGVLDFAKDITPELDKFMKDNPKAYQEDIQDFFRGLNHRLVLERGKVKGRKEKRDAKESRPANKSVPVLPDKLPPRTGNFHKDADAVLDAMNVRE